MTSHVDLLKSLQDWYVSRCDGSWEHTYGVSITTLDNPGWAFNVDLTDTNLFHRPFNEITFEGAEKNDWYVCKVNGTKFEGYCGPNRLGDVIAVFLSWADGTA